MGADRVLAELVLATAAGDRHAFEDLYDRSRSRLFGIVLRIVRQRESAEDVLQEVYLRIWNHAPRYSPALGAPMAWMATIARNRALDWQRRDHHEIALDGDVPVPPPEDGPAFDPERHTLVECLEELSAEQRDCIVLAFVDGYTHDELSRRLGSPIGTVKSWIRRGLFKLKDCIDR